MLLSCTIDTKITWVFWIVFSSNVKIDALGESSPDWHVLLKAEVSWQKAAVQTVAQNGISWEWRSWLAAEDWVLEQTDLSPFLPLVKFSLHVPSPQLQEDIRILGVFLILLVLSFTWYLCAMPLQNRPTESHWSPSGAGPCAWGQYLCCSVTVLVNFLTLTGCFKISCNMGATELDFVLSFHSADEMVYDLLAVVISFLNLLWATHTSKALA